MDVVGRTKLGDSESAADGSAPSLENSWRPQGRGVRILRSPPMTTTTTIGQVVKRKGKWLQPTDRRFESGPDLQRTKETCFGSSTVERPPVEREAAGSTPVRSAMMGNSSA